MTVCRFFLRGICRYGDRCRNEHPEKNSNSFTSKNPFAPLQSNASNNNRPSPFQSSSTNRDNRELPYKLDKNSIINDLSKERPLWILSAYGAGRDAPQQLFGGSPREQSFEEMRLHHYQLAASGNVQQAVQDAQNLVSSAEQQIQTALNDVDGAIKYIIDGENQHPNRIDVCSAKGGPTTQMQNSRGAQQPTSPFGQPSTFGRPSATSAASQPTNPAFARPAAAFGQPSAPVSAFGQPSSMSQQPSAFGQPSSLGGKLSAFGQPSGFGQPSQLGRPSTSFGQPTSSFGQPSSSAPTFGQPSAPSAFGQNQQQTSAFVQPANSLGAPLAPSQQGVFGQPSLPAAAPSANPFGQSAAALPSPFRQTQSGPTTGAFGRSSAPTTNTPLGNTNTTSTSTVLQNHAQRDRQGKLMAWKGQRVTYVEDEPCFKRSDGALEKICFPDGPQPFGKGPEIPDEAYDEATKENYMFMKEQGAFKDGIMPLLPPKREWVDWDF